MDTGRRVALSVVVWAVLMAGLGRPDASGQSLGTFRWQFFPFCNVVTLSAVQEGAAFMLSGSDNQCGGPALAAATGTAFNNPNGTIGMGLTIVPPGGVPVSAAIVLNAITLSGTWTDDAGNNGEFRFNPSTVAGSPRPAGSTLITGTQIAPGAVNTGAIADGTIGAADVNPAEVQLTLQGSCAAGLFLQAVNADGTLVCTDGAAALGNTALGTAALANATVGGNTAVGSFALRANTTGGNNTAVGSDAMFLNTQGTANTAVGVNALLSNIDGFGNTALRSNALTTNSSNNFSTAVGERALFSATGANNIGLGHQAGQNQTTGTNGIYIGNLGVAAESSTIRIGNPIHSAAFIAGINGATAGGSAPVLVGADGKLGTVTPSSRRVKEEIRDMGDASRGVMRLRPVVYRYRQEFSPGDRRLEYGLIAEEVATVLPELVYLDEDGQPRGVQYHTIPMMLLNELQRQERELAALRAELADLRARFEALGTPRRAARADE